MRRVLSQRKSAGLTLLELLIVVAVGATITAIALPVLGNALQRMHLGSMASSVSSAVLKTRYQAIKNSQIYTLTITTPANTYVVTNVSTATVGPTSGLPAEVTLNGGTAGTYTYTFCPNGVVYGAGGVCPGLTLPGLIKATVQNGEVDISISSVGNVTTTTIK